MCYKVTETVKRSKKQLKNNLLSRINDHEVTMLLFDHFSIKIGFFKLEIFLFCFTYLISSSQNFVTFSLKTDNAIKRSYLF